MQIEKEKIAKKSSVRIASTLMCVMNMKNKIILDKCIRTQCKRCKFYIRCFGYKEKRDAIKSKENR